MKTIYKKVKTLVPFCEVCGEKLSGNGSDISPYWCKCGEWKWVNSLDGIWELKLKGRVKIKK